MARRFYPRAGPYDGRTVKYLGYDHNKRETARLAVGPEMHRAVSAIGQRALLYAEMISPNDSQEYQAGWGLNIHIVPDIPFRQRGTPMARWACDIVNHSDHAILVEVGGGYTFPYRILRRTLEWIESVKDD